MWKGYRKTDYRVRYVVSNVTLGLGATGGE
jgi:hypothetical protein